MTRKEQKELRRMQIIQTALTLFVQQGYYGTKTSQISRQAKMSEGLLFHYFPSKEALLEELVKIGTEGMQFPMHMEAENGLAFFRKFTELLFQYLQENPFMAQMFVFMGHVTRSPDIPERIRKLAVSVDTIGFSKGIIEAGQKDGSIREGDPLTLSNMYWSSIYGIAEQYAMRPEIPLPEPDRAL